MTRTDIYLTIMLIAGCILIVSVSSAFSPRTPDNHRPIKLSDMPSDMQEYVRVAVKSHHGKPGIKEMVDKALAVTIAKMFDVFSSSYTASSTVEQRELAYRRLERGTLSAYAAAGRLIVMSDIFTEELKKEQE